MSFGSDSSAPVSILGADGVATSIARDGFGMPLSVTRTGTYAGLPIAATRSYVYDGFERLCKRIDPEAGGTLFEYDGVGNLIGSAEGQSSSLSCDAIPAAARISRSYDARDRLTRVAAPNAPVTLYGYAADGALTTLTQGESVWDYSYNNRRLLTSETLSFGDTYAFTYGYNTLGHLTSTTTPGGVSIDTAPNALGQATKAGTFASGAQYFPDGSLKQFSYGNGLIHSVTQNGRHLPAQVRDALGTQVVHDFTYSYDRNGNVLGIVDKDQTGLQTRTLIYDARDRLVSATATQLWGTASYAYDLSTSTAYLAGFQTRTTNPNGQSTTVSFQAYDSPDTSAPISILGPDGVATSIARDGFGMPLSVTRSGLYAGLPIAATRNYVYDGFERLCKRVDPEAGGTLFEYDGAGNLIGSAEGQSSSLGCTAIPAAARIDRRYDARDRLTRVAAPNAPVTLYGYAADGALTTLTQGENVVWDYSYNNRRLLASETLSFGDTYRFEYSYTPLGHLAGMSYPRTDSNSNLSVDYAPNALGQATKAGTFASGATYFPDGSLKQFTYGNGLTHTVTQNGRHLPLRVRDALGTQVVHDFNYSYDPNGNVTVIDDALNVQDRTLAYDARDRLIAASGVWGVAGYAYDPLDNLRLNDQGSRQFRYQYDGNNRLTQLTDPTGTLVTDFAYDVQGRQIRKGTQTRTFDGSNRITAINGETYAYDGSGRRIATWAADGRTKVEVYTQDGKLGFAVDSGKGGGSSFVYLAGQRIAEDHWNCASNTHTATYFHADALGSPVATTDAARNVLERTYYAPYGEALNRTVDGPGYTGHVMDAATGLVYAQQRYYDPLVGKFLSIDPVAANPNTGGNFNRYWYANNNPYKFTDPDGRSIFTKLIKFVINGGDVAQTVAGVVDDFNTLTDSDASLGSRVLAGASLISEVVSPVSGK